MPSSITRTALGFVLILLWVCFFSFILAAMIPLALLGVLGALRRAIGPLVWGQLLGNEQFSQLLVLLFGPLVGRTMIERLRAAWIDHDENRDVLLIEQIRVQQQGRVRRAAIERELNMGRKERVELIRRFLWEMALSAARAQARARMQAEENLLANNQMVAADESDEPIDGDSTDEDLTDGEGHH